MFILSCGRSSLGAAEIERDENHHVDGDRTRIAAAVTPLDARRGSGGSGGDLWGGSRSDRTEGEAPAPFRRLDLSLSNYDSMATRLKTASRTDFPSLWAAVARETSTKRTETLTTSRGDGQEIPVPDLHVGQYQFFCQPRTWSSVFASPGDFTVRVDAAFEQNGEVMLRIAVVCCSVRAIKDATAIATTAEATKRKSFVKFVERSERELIKFSETVALKYLGHRLIDKLPKLTLSVLSSSQPQLEEYAEALTSFLCYVLSITEIGYNQLLVITEPVAKNIIVREFFGLSLGFGDPGMVSTSSCDARLERRAAENRPLLPSAWFSLMNEAHSKSFCLPGHHESPRRTRPVRALSSRLSDSGYDFKPSGFRSPHRAGVPPETGLDGKCILFIKPSRWKQEKLTPGGFTVEITNVTISEGRANYTICVLFFVRGHLEIATVDRRFSEFDSLVNRIESKLRTLSVRNQFPNKTLFRYLSVSYLERRAAQLQRFLEKLLQMRFLGVLDQEITMVAEPNVRKFLNLPSVQWNITPWHTTRTPRLHRQATHARRMEPSSTPTSRAYLSPDYTSSPNSSASIDTGAYENDDPSSPHYYAFARGRSGSM